MYCMVETKKFVFKLYSPPKQKQTQEKQKPKTKQSKTNPLLKIKKA